VFMMKIKRTNMVIGLSNMDMFMFVCVEIYVGFVVTFFDAMNIYNGRRRNRI
jgi:hypothetical protein